MQNLDSAVRETMRGTNEGFASSYIVHYKIQVNEKSKNMTTFFIQWHYAIKCGNRRLANELLAKFVERLQIEDGRK